jgi:hypothetical protein
MNDDAEVFEPGGDVSQLDFRFNEPGRPPLSEIYPKLFGAHTGHGLAAGPRPTDSWYLAHVKCNVALSIPAGGRRGAS